MIGQVGFPFIKRARIPDVLWAFGLISKNWDPLKGMWRLPCVNPFGSRHDNIENSIIYEIFGSKVPISFLKCN